MNDPLVVILLSVWAGALLAIAGVIAGAWARGKSDQEKLVKAILIGADLAYRKSAGAAPPRAAEAPRQPPSPQLKELQKRLNERFKAEKLDEQPGGAGDGPGVAAATPARPRV